MRRRLLAVTTLVAASFGAMAALGAPVASAHPLGNFTINRSAALLVMNGSIEIRYVVDMAEIPTFQETPRIDTNGDGSIEEMERQTWSDRETAAILKHLAVNVDGSVVELTATASSLRFRAGQAGLPILYFTAKFRGVVPTSGRLRYADGNYPGRIGWKEVTAATASGVAIASSTVPTASVSRELTAYPKDLLSSPLDVTTATLMFHPGRNPIVVTPARPKGSVAGSPVASGGSFAALVGRPLTPLVLAVSLALAFGFGAVHALGPGHGKTITAAYLVGQGARARQAAAVGAAVALMHTASVLLLGLVVFVIARSFPPDRVYPWLTLATGLVALGLGLGLLLARIRARRRGLEPWHGHEHVHPHTHGRADHAHPAPISGRGLAALAVAGGILPSPTAFVVLTGAVAAHRVGYGLALILVFSVGLAASLMAVGLLALRARAAVSRSLAGRWMGLIPIASALVILAFGVFFASRGISQLG